MNFSRFHVLRIPETDYRPHFTCGEILCFLKQCSNVCELRLCLATESANSARMRTIVTAALQRQYSQTELTFWITYVLEEKYENN
jgi:hypothetical protein